MQRLIICLIFGFFVTCIQSHIVLDIYHDKIRYDNELLANNQTPKQTNETIGLFKYLNSQYYSLIRVGKPAKEFKVIFDTSWADSWLPSEHCALYEIACTIHTRYDSTKSSTYKANGAKYVRESDTMSLKGFLSVDDFHLPHMKVANQTFVEVTSMSSKPFLLLKSDGIIGLAFSSLASNGTQPFFYNMIKQNLIKKNVFTFYMNRDPTTLKAGNLILGGTDRSHINTSLTYLPVREKKYWTIRMDKIIMEDNNKYYSYCDGGCNAILDTSSNAIVGPADVITQINNMLGAKSIVPFWPFTSMVDCRTFAKLPHITFVLAGKNFTIESKYYVHQMIYYSWNICLSPFIPSTTSNIWQLGGAFLMQFYTEFDLDQGRIGIAETII